MPPPTGPALIGGGRDAEHDAADHAPLDAGLVVCSVTSGSYLALVIGLDDEHALDAEATADSASWRLP